MKSRKLGLIRISEDIAHSEDQDGARRLLFQAFHPYKIELSDSPTVLNYYGICNTFGEVPEGEQIPEYRALFSRKGDTVSLNFERV